MSHGPEYSEPLLRIEVEPVQPGVFLGCNMLFAPGFGDPAVLHADPLQFRQVGR